jgi:hypothetical protein
MQKVGEGIIKFIMGEDSSLGNAGVVRGLLKKNDYYNGTATYKIRLQFQVTSYILSYKGVTRFLLMTAKTFILVTIALILGKGDMFTQPYGTGAILLNLGLISDVTCFFGGGWLMKKLKSKGVTLPLLNELLF